MDLVDEEDDVAPGPDLLQDLLQALFEVAAIAGTGHEGTEVERVELAVVEGLGNLVGDDSLGQTFDDGGLADAGLSDQDRVVLGAAGEDLHDPLDLAGPPDDRVELALPGHLREVATELVEDGRAGRGRLAGGGRVAGAGLLLGAAGAVEKLDDGVANLGEFGAELLQNLSGDSFAFADQTEQDVLGPDVVVTELQRFSQ